MIILDVEMAFFFKFYPRRMRSAFPKFFLLWKSWIAKISKTCPFVDLSDLAIF